MKKTMYFLMLAIAACMVSCGKDNATTGDNGENGGNTEKPVDKPETTVITASLPTPSEVSFTMDDYLSKASDTFTLTLSDKAGEMFIADLSVLDADGMTALPETAYTLSATTFMVGKGATVSNEITFSLTGNLEGIEAGKTYGITYRITVDAGLADKYKAGNATRSFSLTVDALPEATPGIKSKDLMGTIATIKDGEVVDMGDNTHTFQIRICANEWHLDNEVNYIGSWRGKDKNHGNEDFDGMEMRFRGTSSITSNHGNRQCDLTLNNKGDEMETGRWYTLTFTCDGSKTGQSSEIAYQYYLDDKLIAEAAPSKRYGTGSSQGFQAGYTLTGFKFGFNNAKYYFDGLIGEIRLWNKVLSAEEIAATLVTVPNPSRDDFYAYWKVDEGSGNILKDASGHGRDLIVPDTVTLEWGGAAE